MSETYSLNLLSSLNTKRTAKPLSGKSFYDFCEVCDTTTLWFGWLDTEDKQCLEHEHRLIMPRVGGATN